MFYVSSAELLKRRQLSTIIVSLIQSPDTLENCDLGYIPHFLLAVATQEVKTVKGQWLTSPVKKNNKKNTNQSNKLGIMPVN